MRSFRFAVTVCAVLALLPVRLVALSDVPAVFRVPAEVAPQALWWSAEPLEAQMSPEAWAPIAESVVGEGIFEPGRYRVSALAADDTRFEAVVEIVPGERNEFVIPLAAEDRVDDDTIVVTCRNQPAGCDYQDPVTGLAVVVPNGWEMEAPYFYQTAAGVRAQLPTVYFMGESDGESLFVVLNPRQWLASNGPCVQLGDSSLCHFETTQPGISQAVEVIRDGLDFSAVDGAKSGP